MANLIRSEAQKTSESYQMDPLRLVIREDDPTHPAYKMRADRREIDPVMLAAMLRFGCGTRTIQVIRDGKDVAVVTGRRFVLCVRRANEIRVAENKAPWTVTCADTGKANAGIAMSLENAYQKANNAWLAAVEFGDRVVDCNGDVSAAMLACGIRDERTATRFMKLLNASMEVKLAVAGGAMSLAVVDQDGASILDLAQKDQTEAVKTYLSASASAEATGTKPLRGRAAKAAAKAAIGGGSVAEVKAAAEAPKELSLQQWVEALAEKVRDGSEAQALLQWLLTKNDALLDIIPETGALVTAIRDGVAAKQAERVAKKAEITKPAPKPRKTRKTTVEPGAAVEPGDFALAITDESSEEGDVPERVVENDVDPSVAQEVAAAE